MIGQEKLFYSEPDSFERVRFADLADYYPAQSPPAQTVNGTQPAAPQNSPAGTSGASGANTPALYLILFIAAGLLLLHTG